MGSEMCIRDSPTPERRAGRVAGFWFDAYLQDGAACHRCWQGVIHIDEVQAAVAVQAFVGNEFAVGEDAEAAAGFVAPVTQAQHAGGCGVAQGKGDEATGAGVAAGAAAVAQCVGAVALQGVRFFRRVVAQGDPVQCTGIERTLACGCGVLFGLALLPVVGTAVFQVDRAAAVELRVER